MDELEDFMYDLESKATQEGKSFKDFAEELLSTPSKLRQLHVAEERAFTEDDLRRKLEDIVYE
jgi:hypothetical protein